MDKLEIVKVDSKNKDVICMCQRLDDFVNYNVAKQRDPTANCTESLNKYANIFVSYSNNKPSGFVAFSNVNDGVVEIGQIFVDNAFRSQRIGTQFVKLAEAFSKQNGAKKVFIYTYELLEKAVLFYEKHNFKKIALPGCPYIIMEKFLTDGLQNDEQNHK